MDIWGYEPYENDVAGDWLKMEVGNVAQGIREALESDDYDIIRAAAFLLSRVGESYLCPDYTLLDLAIDVMNNIKEDQEWINKWEDPQQMRITLQNQIDGLINLRGE